MANSGGGSLTLAGTPIGNVEDASPRLVQLLETADIVAAEDTRRVRDLARRLGVTMTGRVVSYYEHNEAERVAPLLAAIEEGASVVLVTDAGMPAVSDPGFRLVAAAALAGLPITCAPGPSAVTTALALSGLPSDRFTFEGFLPRKTGDRSRFLQELSDERRTMVFFEAPHRVAESVADLGSAFGADRPAALCRELTKTYEEVLRLPLGELSDTLRQREKDPTGIRGEIVIVVQGADKREADLNALVEEVQERVAAGQRLKEAATAVATEHNASKRELYNLALAAPRLP